MTVLLYILQISECRPIFFQEYRKNQQKLRGKRLKKSAAEQRLGDLQDRFKRRVQSRQNSHDNGLTPWHAKQTKWIKTDMLHTQVKANIRRHRLTSKLLKGNQEINDILEHRANELEEKSKEIQEQKNQIKSQGHKDFSNDKIYRKNFKAQRKAYDTFDKKTNKCMDIIRKNEKDIAHLEQNQNRCSIL